LKIIKKNDDFNKYFIITHHFFPVLVSRTPYAKVNEILVCGESI